MKGVYDIIFLDDEMDIIRDIHSGLGHYDILQYNGNSFDKKILKFVQNLNKFTENNGHDALPPDFYSDEFSCMFDVMRINDSEIKKSYNPVKIRERKIEKEIKQSGLFNPNSTLFISSESDDEKEHTLQNYVRNCNRVMSEHIKKIDIWQIEHPDIKYKGLLVFDETNCYFEGKAVHVFENQYLFMWDKNKPLMLHKPWMHECFVKDAYESDLDFIIWFCPYKSHGKVCEYLHCDYPEIIILDTRFPRTDYINYDISKFVNM